MSLSVQQFIEAGTRMALHNLSARSAVVLVMCLSGEQRTGDLAKACNVDMTSISWVYRNLENLGLVERLPDPTSGKQILIKITDAGSKLAQEVLK